MIWIYTIVSTVAVSLISLIGVFLLSFKKNTIEKINFFLISFATGALFSGAFFHLIPQALQATADHPIHDGHHHPGTITFTLVLAGIFIFFIFEKVIIWRKEKWINLKNIHNSGFVSLFADGFHNLIDGILIAVAYLADVELGVVTTVIVLLHEIPQEIGDFAILVHSGFNTKKALLLNLLSAVTAILGAIVALFIGTSIEGITSVIIPISAGGFIYLAGSNLIPELHKKTDAKSGIIQILAFAAGMLFLYLFTLIEH